MLKTTTAFMTDGRRPFVPTSALHSCTLFPMFDLSDGLTGYDRFDISETGFIISKNFEKEVSYGTTIVMLRPSKYLPDIDVYSKRLEYLGSTGKTDVAGYEWFIKLFKYAVFPQMLYANKLYRVNSTQYALLYGLFTLFADKFSPDMKSLMYQAMEHPSAREKGDGNFAVFNAVFTHQQFADWMHSAIQVIPYQVLVKITRIMFGRLR